MGGSETDITQRGSSPAAPFPQIPLQELHNLLFPRYPRSSSAVKPSPYQLLGYTSCSRGGVNVGGWKWTRAGVLLVSDKDVDGIAGRGFWGEEGSADDSDLAFRTPGHPGEP